MTKPKDEWTELADLLTNVIAKYADAIELDWNIKTINDARTNGQVFIINS